MIDVKSSYQNIAMDNINRNGGNGAFSSEGGSMIEDLSVSNSQFALERQSMNDEEHSC